MAKYASREEMFDDYLTTNRSTWDKWIMSLTIPASRINQVLYHISFKDDLEGDWRPLKKKSYHKTNKRKFGMNPYQIEYLLRLVLNNVF